MEEGHLVASGAVTFSDSDGGGGSRGFGMNNGWWEGEVGDVSGVAAVAGSCVRFTCGDGGR